MLRRWKDDVGSGQRRSLRSCEENDRHERRYCYDDSDETQRSVGGGSSNNETWQSERRVSPLSYCRSSKSLPMLQSRDADFHYNQLDSMLCAMSRPDLFLKRNILAKLNHWLNYFGQMYKSFKHSAPKITRYTSNERDEYYTSSSQFFNGIQQQQQHCYTSEFSYGEVPDDARGYRPYYATQ